MNKTSNTWREYLLGLLEDAIEGKRPYSIAHDGPTHKLWDRRFRGNDGACLRAVRKSVDRTCSTGAVFEIPCESNFTLNGYLAMSPDEVDGEKTLRIIVNFVTESSTLQ